MKWYMRCLLGLISILCISFNAQANSSKFCGDECRKQKICVAKCLKSGAEKVVGKHYCKSMCQRAS